MLLSSRPWLCGRPSFRIFQSGIHCSADYQHVLHPERMNQRVTEAEYAVRGRLVLEAEKLAKKLQTPDHGLPFEEIIFCNIGNPQAVGQQPMTFHRQVMSLCLNPDLLEDDNLPYTKKMFPADTIKRARKALKGTTGGFGAYSHSKGVEWMRNEVANYIVERDGEGECDPENLFLTNGASEGIAKILQILVRDSNDGILIPIPQYPLYSATLSLLGATPIPYYLDESKDWSFDMDNLQSAVQTARENGIEPRGMVVINPGNPTGQVLTEESISDVLKFCNDERVVLMADEVYQPNIYNPERPFYSFKQVLNSLPDAWNTELVSFHSTSKGFLGECGFRGGYMEIVNMHPEVLEQLYKLLSINLCSNLPGQLMTSLMVNPPKDGDESYPLYAKERDAILSSLARRSAKVTSSLNSMEGISCNPSEGAMYVFPTITLPVKAVEEAERQNLVPDVFYCLELLANTGICVVPGSGFGQRDGTFHFRGTFLPAEEKINMSMELMERFHNKFIERFSH